MTATFLQRVLKRLPRWFGSSFHFALYLATGDGFVFSTVQQQIDNITPETSLDTATGVFLDIAAFDYFGNTLLRSKNETDGAFIIRLLAALLPLRATDAALRALLNAYPNIAYTVIRQRYPQDTKTVSTQSETNGTSQIFMDAQGHIASDAYPFQCFVDIISSVAMSASDVSNLYTAIAAIAPEGVIIWVNLVNPGPIVATKGVSTWGNFRWNDGTIWK